MADWAQRIMSMWEWIEVQEMLLTMSRVRFEARDMYLGKQRSMVRLYSSLEFEQIPLEELLKDFKKNEFHWAYRTKLEYDFDEPGGFDNKWLPWQAPKND